MDGGLFTTGIDQWLARLGNLRNVVRQELVTRQLRSHLPDPADTLLSVLDVGAGQGTQAIRLARLGARVTALDPDPRMRDAFAVARSMESAATRRRLEIRPGGTGSVAVAVGDTAYDVVVCHGVLMYLPEPTAAITELAGRVAPGGVLSLVARNGEAMAWRPALRRDWSTAGELLDETEAARLEGRDPCYRNEIGVQARADTVEALQAACRGAGLVPEAWYGIRVATDGVPAEEAVPEDPTELAALLDVEERLGAADPYRRVATLLHVLARRPVR